MKIRYLLSFSLLSTAVHAQDDRPFDFECLQGQGVMAQQATLHNFVKKHHPTIPPNRPVFDLKLEAYEINTALYKQQLICLAAPKVDPLLRAKLENKKKKLITARLQLADQKVECNRLQNQIKEQEDQLLSLKDNQQNDQANILTLRQQLEDANKKFNAKQEELEQAQNKYDQQTQELQRQIPALIRLRHHDQQILAKMQHQLQDVHSKIADKQAELDQEQKKYRQEISTLNLGIEKLSNTHALDQQALDDLRTQIETSSDQFHAKEEEFTRTQDKHIQKIRKLKNQIATLTEVGAHKQQILDRTQEQLNSVNNEILSKQREFEAICEAHTHQVHELKEQLKILKKSEREKQQALDEQQNQLQEMKNETQDTKNHLAETQKTHTHQVQNLEEQLRALRQSEREKQQALDEHKVNLEEARTELRDQAERYAINRSAVEDRAHRQEEEARMLRKMNEDKQQALILLQAQLTAVTRELNKLKRYQIFFETVEEEAKKVENNQENVNPNVKTDALSPRKAAVSPKRGAVSPNILREKQPSSRRALDWKSQGKDLKEEWELSVNYKMTMASNLDYL